MSIKAETIATIALSACLLNCYADSRKYVYTYDAAGNRIRREISAAEIPPQNRMVVKSNSSISDTDIQLKAYPNPTNGPVTVDISGLADTPGASITVYNTAGSVLIDYKPTESRNYIDLTNHPSGVYYVVVSIARVEYTVKVIKE